MGVKPWPFPEDRTQEDKDRRVARSYRQLVQSIAQGRCDEPAGDLHRLDQHWIDLGQFWVLPRQAPLDYDDWMCAADIVVAFEHRKSLTEGQIRNWAYLKRKGGDGIIEQPGPDGRPTYNVGDIVDYLHRQTNRRINRHTSDSKGA